jgi:multidrug/hemolysin transport system permease protein
MDSWIMAGLLAVTTLTTTLGALGTMVDDRSKKIIKDFYSSPVKRSYIAGGYVVSAFLIGVILSLVALVLAEIYIVAYGGSLLGGMALLKVFGLILLSSIASTSMVFFLATFLRSQNAFGVASTVIGTLVGFLTGIYLPTGMLPESIQYVVKCFPISHAAVLLRKVVMEAPLAQMFSGAPEAYRAGLRSFTGSACILESGQLRRQSVF